jgi:hypothetical protein
MWLQIVSHKLLRLACPFALIGLLFASIALSLRADLPPIATSSWQALALSQLWLYGCAAAGARAGLLGSLARTFAVLNAAAVAGLVRFARGSQPITW